MSSESHELLTSPIERRSVSRLFIFGAPLGLAIAIVLSLWVSQRRVTNAVVVQAQSQWIAGEQLALRVQVTPESPQEVGPAQVRAEVEQGGQRHALEDPRPVELEGGGLAQGRVTVPALALGPATLHLHIEATPFAPRDEAIAIEIVERREPRPAQHVISSSMSQYADDSDPHPEGVRIDVRPVGRVLAGFDNTLLLRAIDASSGEPWRGPAAVYLIDGELEGRKGNADDPPRVWKGATDAAGLARFHGTLSSEVLRLLVRLYAPDEPTRLVHERKIRLVSFAGAVQLQVTPSVAVTGHRVDVLAAGLSAKRPVFVDVYGPDGAWIDTFDPPLAGREPPREWTVPSVATGVVQLEAYHFTNSPGESTAVGRMWVESSSEGRLAALLPPGLIAHHRDRLSLPRSDRTWDAAIEKRYLDALERLTDDADGAALGRPWLLGTLPVEVYGPPTLLRSRERDLQAMAEDKHRWIIGLRIFLIGGGSLFLVAMAAMMMRSHGRDAEATLRELMDLNEGVEREQLQLHVHKARRAALLRGMLALVFMVVGLVSAVLLLEALVWNLG